MKSFKVRRSLLLWCAVFALLVPSGRARAAGIVTGDQSVVNPAAVAPLMSLGNLVWLDVNNNGRADSGEPGLGGVPVRLIASNGVTVLGITATNASGLYQFTGLQQGTYFVEVDRTAPAVTGYLSSTDIATSANPDNDINNDDNGVILTPTTVRSGAVTLSAFGEPINDGDADANSNLSIDFGFVRALSLGNLVWADLNDNGRVDPGEPGFAGITVRLIGSNGVTVLATTTTDGNGFYLFGGLVPGGYYVEVVPPPGTRSSTDIATSADPNTDVDSDDNGVTVMADAVRSGLVTLANGTEPTNDGDSNADSNLSVDFGFVPLLPSADTDLCLLQTVPSVVQPGGLLTYIYRATNRGPGPASDVFIEGTVPAGTSLVSATPSAGGSCSVVNGMLDCRWPGVTMPGPASDRVLTLVLQLNPGTPVGTTIWAWFMTNSSTVDSYQSNNMTDGYVFVTDGALPSADLALDGAVTSVSGPRAVTAPVNQPFTLRFTVANTGAVASGGQYALLLSESGIAVVTAVSASQGSVSVSGPDSGLWDTGAIAPGVSAVLDLTFVPHKATALTVSAIRISGSAQDPSALNDSAEVDVDIVGDAPESGRWVAIGNVDGVPGREIVTGAGQGETPQVRVFSGAGTPTGLSFYPFARTFRGGVRVASCDVNGDGFDELVAAQGPGGGQVRVMSLTGNSVGDVVTFSAFESGFTGGVNVACADLDGNGRAEVVVGPDGGRAPDVRVYSVVVGSATQTAQFSAYEPTFTGGVRVSAASFAGSGLVGAFNVATMPGPGRAGELRLWAVNGGSAAPTLQVVLYGSAGASVVLGDANGDAVLDLMAIPDGGSPRLLQVFSLQTGQVLLDAPPGAGGLTSVRAAVGVLAGGPGVPELVIGQGPGGLPTVATFVLTPAGAVSQRLSFTALEEP